MALLLCQCAHVLQHRAWAHNTYQHSYTDWDINTIIHAHTSTLYLHTSDENLIAYATPISGQSQIDWPLWTFTCQKWIFTVLIHDTCITFIWMMYVWLLWLRLSYFGLTQNNIDPLFWTIGFIVRNFLNCPFNFTKLRKKLKSKSNSKLKIL